MQFIKSALLLGAAGLAAAVPVSSPQNPSNGTLVTRGANPNCGLGNYPSATEGPIYDGVQYLRRDSSDQSGQPRPPDDIWSKANQCIVVSCSYGTGISLCDTSGQESQHNPKDLADIVENNYDECYGTLQSTDEGNAVLPYQWWDNGFNVLVQGGFSC